MPESISLPPDLVPALLRRAQAGDEAAFGELMRLHYERVFRLVFSILGNEADARDVCQEVWLTVWRRLPDFRGDAKFTTWLHPIAVRRALDQLRRSRRWYARFLPFGGAGSDVDEIPERAPPVDPRAEVENAERAERLQRALAALPPKLRAVLALREVEGLSYEEIAQVTDLPPGTVMSRLHHARRLLARKLEASP